jgi:hypothetical protein
MKTILTTVAAAILGLSAAAQAGADTYAAIANSKSTGNWAVSGNHGSPEAAENEAIKQCNADDAKAVLWVRGAWCAIAHGEDGAVGCAKANTALAAQTAALKACFKGGAHPHVSACISSDGVVAPIQAVWGNYAAIARSDSTGKLATCTGQASQEEAEEEAIRACNAAGGGDDAKVILENYNGWCAVAVGDGGAVAVAEAATASAARAKAMKLCREKGAHPHIVNCVSSDGKAQK